MKMIELAQHGIPPEIIGLWQEQESTRLLPLQEMAVKRHGLFDRRNLLIQAPTSSGKTFIGEMAAVQTALRRKKVVYLVPLKALAEEKYADFKRKYAAYGMDVILSSRDHREFDAQLEGGNFSIAVVVYEKLAQLLVRRPERLHEIELVIADELEILSDVERGAAIELLLTQLVHGAGVGEDRCAPAMRSGQPPRVIGLSAVIGQAEQLAHWMQAELVNHERRPVELRYGVLHEGVFRYRTYNEYSEAEEELVNAHSESGWETLTQNVCALTEGGESCLVFVKARHESRRGAELLAGRLELPAASQAAEALSHLEATHCRDALMETLGHGVAFHNADLSREERRVVEEAFRKGEVRVLVSTSTLAMGLNLPARNVFITTDKWQYDQRFGMPWKTPILRAEYENMGGRAGRYGSDGEFGRSILIATNPFDSETLWRRYIEGEREKVEPQLARQPLDTHVIRLVASRTCLTQDSLRRFLENTLTGQWIWTRSLSLEEMEFRVRAAVNRAADAGMLARHGNGRLKATPFGQVVAAKGVRLDTAQDLARWINESETRLWSNLDLLVAAAATADGRMLQMTLTAGEYDHAGYEGQLKLLTQDEDLSADVPLNRLRNCTLKPFFDEVRGIKTALILNDWLDEAALYDLEERYRTLTGQIASAAEQVNWLIDTAEAIAAAFGAQDEFRERLRTLADRVKYGLRASTLPLTRVPGLRLDRAVLLRLAAHELTTPEAVAAAPLERLSVWMTKPQARTLHQWARNRTAACNQASRTHTARVPAFAIDETRPGEVYVDGETVVLQEKQYQLARLLAASPGECVPYERIYEVIWGDAIVESNQMHFQKQQLLARIKKVAPKRKSIIRTLPKRGFLLDLTPDEVAFTRVNAA